MRSECFRKAPHSIDGCSDEPRCASVERWPPRFVSAVFSAARPIVIAFLGVGALLGASLDKVRGTEPISFVTACADCGAGTPSPIRPTPHDIVGHDGAACTGCHGDATEGGHPIGFRPDRPLPALFPLDVEGKFACITCHELKTTTPGRVRTTERGQSFCQSCHDPNFFTAMPDRGTSLFAAPHLDFRGNGPSGLDPISARCLGCHDNEAVMASNDSMFGAAAHFSGPSSHPVGRSYREAAAYGGYRAAEALSAEVLLPGGTVGCISCHVPYSREHARQPRTQAGVCLECHEM